MQRSYASFDHVGSRIRSRRKSMGISMKNLSEQLECNYKYLSDVELGKEKPSLEMLMKISNILDKGVDYFVMDYPEANPSYRIDFEMAEKLRRCNPMTLAAVSHAIDNLLQLQESLLQETTK